MSAYLNAAGVDTPTLYINGWALANSFNNLPNTSSASFDFLGKTDGLERTGFASLAFSLDGDRDVSSGWQGILSIDGLGSWSWDHLTALRLTKIPFTLGQPFGVHSEVKAWTSGGLNPTGAGVEYHVGLTLTESDGTAVLLHDPPALPTPEPVYGLLVVLVLLIICWLSKKKHES